MLKKIFTATLLSLLLFSPTYAAGLLPSFDEAVFTELANDYDQDKIMDAYEMSESAGCKELIEQVFAQYGEKEAKEYIGSNENEYTETFLACGIKSGNIEFWMVPYYVTYALGFLLGLSGLLAVLMILVGAYFYIAGGVSDDKEKGKTIIKYALGGLVLTSLAWILVNFILLLITA